MAKKTRIEELQEQMSRLEQRIREAMGAEANPLSADCWLSAPRVEPAVFDVEHDHAEALAIESRAAVLAAGLVPCGMPWCGNAATHVWYRTPGEIKAMTRRGKKCQTVVEGKDFSCESHIPVWRRGSYVPYDQGQAA